MEDILGQRVHFDANTFRKMPLGNELLNRMQGDCQKFVMIRNFWEFSGSFIRICLFFSLFLVIVASMTVLSEYDEASFQIVSALITYLARLLFPFGIYFSFMISCFIT